MIIHSYYLNIIFRKIIVDSISSKPIKNYYLYELTRRVFDSSKEKYAEDFYTFFKDNVDNEIYKNIIKTHYNKITSMNKGVKSPTFENFESFNGQKVSLNDFLDSYVYIDVWATWCIPCIIQVPYLQELEEEYKTKNIKFVSISVDIHENKEKWKRMITTKNFKGIQLLADNDFESKFIKTYNINSIPRFILIDPKGNIVSENAPKPSSPELKKLFDKEQI